MAYRLWCRSYEEIWRDRGHVDRHEFPARFRFELCSSRLSQGKFNSWDGWEFRSAFSITFQGYNGFKMKIPWWMGQKVDHLVVLGEQGIGDEILYGSAIPELIVRLGHKAIEYRCHPRIKQIFERSLKIRCTDRPKLGEISEGDAVVALSDLFMFYRKDKAHFPKKPFLKPDSERIR